MTTKGGFPETGDHLKFLGCSKDQISFGGNQDPNGILFGNEVYTVTRVEVHSWYTKVWVTETDWWGAKIGEVGPFNSVCFEEI